MEAYSSEIHGAIREERTSIREIVEAYLSRIEDYDKLTGLNAIVVVNTNAVEMAEKLDDKYWRTGEKRPLHVIPFIVKDNNDTSDLQTSVGSIAFEGSIPPDDAYQVRVLREVGAVVLTKLNRAELAFDPYETIRSTAGITRNH